MRVNGKNILLENSLSLSEFLEQNKFSSSKIAVEKNGKIVCKSDFEKILLSNEDTLEIVQFVGGG